MKDMHKTKTPAQRMVADLDAMLNLELMGVNPDALTLAQAKALYEYLNSLFGKKQ